MRRILAAAATAVVSVALAGCGESDAAFRDAYRTRSVDSCAAGANAAAAQMPGLDARRLCECAVDRYMTETPIEQLRAEEKQREAPPAAQRALTQCLTEQMRASAKS